MVSTFEAYRDSAYCILMALNISSWSCWGMLAPEVAQWVIAAFVAVVTSSVRGFVEGMPVALHRRALEARKSTAAPCRGKVFGRFVVIAIGCHHFSGAIDTQSPSNHGYSPTMSSEHGSSSISLSETHFANRHRLKRPGSTCSIAYKSSLESEDTIHIIGQVESDELSLAKQATLAKIRADSPSEPPRNDHGMTAREMYR